MCKFYPEAPTWLGMADGDGGGDEESEWEIDGDIKEAIPPLSEWDWTYTTNKRFRRAWAPLEPTLIIAPRTNKTS